MSDELCEVCGEPVRFGEGASNYDGSHLRHLRCHHKPNNSAPEDKSLQMNELNNKIEEIFKQFYDAGADSVLIDWKRNDIQKLNKEATQAIQDLIEQELAEQVRLGIEASKIKEPFKCEFGHEVYGHKTVDGWCCACEADQAFMYATLEQEGWTPPTTDTTLLEGEK